MAATPRTLHGRLASWYAAVLAVTLVAFAAAVYLLVEDEDAGDRCEPAASCRLVDPPEHLAGRLGAAVAVALPGALAVAFIGGVWVTRRNLQPLDDIARVAGELGGDTLDRRVTVPADAAVELVRLGDALNLMLARIDQSVHGMRRFTANASHELRTPLAALRGELEVTLRHPRSDAELRHACESALEEVARLSDLVDLLLTLARSDTGELPVQPRAVDVVELARRVAAPYEAVASARGVRLEYGGAAAAPLVTDPLWLERALANLVDNACKLTPAGGVVRVDTVVRDERVELVVGDSGPGVAEDERGRIFERFYRGRGAQRTAGFGLGLALASDVVHVLGGTLTLGTSDLGGARFTIALPVRAPG